MGSVCCAVKSHPSRDELNPIEHKAHGDIEEGLMKAHKSDSRVKKLLLLGSGSSGKSTFFRQLHCMHSGGFAEVEVSQVVTTIRLNCVAAIMILLKKTQELYEQDEKENADCFIDLDQAPEDLLAAIRTVVEASRDTFAGYENDSNIHAYMNNEDDDDVTIDDVCPCTQTCALTICYTMHSG